MKFESLKYIAIGLGALFMSANASAETLRVGMECTYAPFNYKNAEGELVGFSTVLPSVAGIERLALPREPVPAEFGADAKIRAGSPVQAERGFVE